jgi:uncharacterized protein (TIGR02594 family)
MTTPFWIDYAQKQIGLREIKGARHEPRILAMIKRIGRWAGVTIKDDETPWCGTFAADCMLAAGINPPPIAVRARPWGAWGTPVTPRVGAVLVFGREGGGGHVGFYVGEDATRFYVLGGNQGDAVKISPILKSRLLACRWPPGIGVTTQPKLMTLAMASSQNEA